MCTATECSFVSPNKSIQCVITVADTSGPDGAFCAWSDEERAQNVRLLPNGLLEIRGEKWLTLNRGEELVRIRGYVRQEDITPDNTVQSTKVADARITYAGTGELADSNEMGWLSKFFNSRWFPF